MDSHWLWAMAGAGIVALGCGSNKTAGATASAAASSGAGASGSASATTGGPSSATSSGSGGMAPMCPATSPANPGNKVAIGTVKVKVVDKNGVGISGANIDVQLCGTDLCLNFMTGGDGNFTVSGGGKTLLDPAFKYGGQSHSDYLFWGAQFAGGDVDFGTATAAALGPNGAKLTPGQMVSSNGVTLALPSGGTVVRDNLPPDDPFRAVVFKPGDGTFPPLATFPQLPPNKKLIGVVGLGPAEVDMCPAASLSFPNPDPAVAQPTLKVELWLNGVKTYANWVPYGQWAKVADAEVSADGKTIATTAASGIPALGAYAVVLIGPAA